MRPRVTPRMPADSKHTSNHNEKERLIVKNTTSRLSLWLRGCVGFFLFSPLRELFFPPFNPRDQHLIYIGTPFTPPLPSPAHPPAPSFSHFQTTTTLIRRPLCRLPLSFVPRHRQTRRRWDCRPSLVGVSLHGYDVRGGWLASHARGLLVGSRPRRVTCVGVVFGVAVFSISHAQSHTTSRTHHARGPKGHHGLVR